MAKQKFERSKPFRNLKERFLILCEGSNTEKIYFESFRLTTATVKVIPVSDAGGNALNFVEKAHQYIGTKSKTEYDYYWLVFDKDENTDQNFNNAIKKAESNNYKVAYSNQAFEVWFILHYENFRQSANRKQLNEKLNKLLGFEYGKDLKTCKKVTELLYPKTHTAIKNATESYNLWKNNENNPAKEESSTTVFQLVESILRNL